VDVQAALVRRADEVDAAEGFFGEAAEVFAPVFIDQQDAPASGEEFEGGYDARQSSAGYDDVGLH
jgi:hypothetical protein